MCVLARLHGVAPQTMPNRDLANKENVSYNLLYIPDMNIDSIVVIGGHGRFVKSL